jgi:RPA family protein
MVMKESTLEFRRLKTAQRMKIKIKKLTEAREAHSQREETPYTGTEQTGCPVQGADDDSSLLRSC